MTTAPAAPTVDPLDDMVNNPTDAATRTPTFFGQVVILDASEWKLVKGVGRVPFDTTYDDPKDRVRAIDIKIECEKRDGSKYTIDTGRQPLLEIEKAWHQHTLKSLKKLNIPLSQLRLKFVQVKRIEMSDTYTDRDGNLKHRTALEFIAAYNDWHAMHAARTALFGERSFEQPSTSATSSAPQQPTATPAINKDSLAKVLPGLWQAAGQNKDVFATMFQANPTFTAAFTLEEALQAATLPF